MPNLIGHALLIGVSQYRHVDSLPREVAGDALAVERGGLQHPEAGYVRQRVRTLTDSGATLEAIREGLRWLAAESNEGSTVLIFFSGHGAIVEGGEGSYLLPCDADPEDLTGSAISADELEQALREIRGSRVVVVLDACHANGVVRKGKSSHVKLGLKTSVYDALSNGEGTVVLASCKDNEFSHIVEGAQNSVFTEVFLEAISGGAAVRDDGFVRVFDTFHYIVAHVRGKFSQTPVLSARQTTENFALAGAAKTPILSRQKATVSQMLSSNASSQLNALLNGMYPAGPRERDLWERAGGDLSSLDLQASGKSQWYKAVRMLSLGGGGAALSVRSLLETVLEDFPNNFQAEKLLSTL